ncbi:MAG: chaperone modulator CbpM [Fimbriimonadaceae bacterium]
MPRNSAGSIPKRFGNTSDKVWSSSRVGAKNRLYSEEDIHRVRRIKRLTQEMGVNLAGVEIILRLFG